MRIGLIYEIVCNETGERYIGSTFHPTIAKRVAKHKADMLYRKDGMKCKAHQIIVRNNYIYGLLEQVEVETRDKLRMCERVWFDKLPNINQNRPFVSKEEEKALHNSICNKTRTNEIIKCECGGHYTSTHKSRHLKSLLHLGII